MELPIIDKTLFLDIGDLLPFDNLEDLLSKGYPDEEQKKTDDASEVDEDYKLLRDIDYKDDYDDYVKINCHLGFSEDLHVLNEKGQYIVNQLKYKVDPDTHATIDVKVETIYNSIRQSIRSRNLGTSTFFNELMCVLDELLFNDVEDMEVFYLNDNEHKLTKIYYGQEEWAEDYEIQHFEFSKNSTLEEGEIMFLLCFVNDYIALLERVIDYIERISDENTASLKVSKIALKILSRLEKAKDLLTTLLSNVLMLEVPI